jgi:hypothetical protein
MKNNLYNTGVVDLVVSEDEDISVWMFAMIGIGCVFIVFVAVSFYIMW